MIVYAYACVCVYEEQENKRLHEGLIVSLKSLKEQVRQSVKQCSRSKREREVER